AAEPDRYMWPWEDEPQSVASGLVHEVAYDWLGVVEPMIRTGGWPVIVDDDQLLEANAVGHDATDIPVDLAGSAGLAGVVECARRTDLPEYGERIAVLFTRSGEHTC